MKEFMKCLMLEPFLKGDEMEDLSWSGMSVQKVLEQIHQTSSDKLYARLCAPKGHTNHGMSSVTYNRICPPGMEGGKFEANFLKKLQDGPVNLMSVLPKWVEITLKNRTGKFLDKDDTLG